MVSRLRTPSSITPLGPNHWRCVVEPELGLRIEPRGYYAPACAAAIVMVALVMIFWFVPSVPLYAKIAASALGAAASSAVWTILVFFDRYERRLGPYMVVDRDAIHLRHGRRIPLSDFACFEVKRRWGPAGDGETLMAYLVLRTKGAEQIELLVSTYHAEIAKLKRTLDDYMGRILSSSSFSDSSAS